MRITFSLAAAVGVFMLAVALPSGAATKIWDGQGGDASWGTPANWDGNSLPAFDGTETISVGTGFVSGVTLTLDGDRSVFNFVQTTNIAITYASGTPSGSKLILKNGCITNTGGSQTHNEAVVLGASGIFNCAGVAGSINTFNGPISEETPNCSITRLSTRSLVLNGTNTFSGGVNVNVGNAGLTLGSDQALGTGTLRINAAATLQTLPTALSITNNVDISSSFTFGAAGTKGLTLNAPGVVTLKTDAQITVSPGGNADLLIFNNGIADDGTPRSLTLTGNNRYVYFNGNSTFSGALTLGGPWVVANSQMATTNVMINSGILYLGAHNPIGTGTVTASTGPYTICSTSTFTGVRRDLDNVFLWRGTNQGGNGYAGVDYNRNGGTSTLIGDFSVGQTLQSTGPNAAPCFWRGLQESGGAWGLKILGASDRWVILHGPSTYSGPTEILHGILQLTDTDALPTNTAVTIAFTSGTDGILDLNGTSHRIGSLAGNGYVKLAAGTLTVGGSSNTTFEGYITGTNGGVLVREGSGILRLNTTNLTYRSFTRVQGGTLQVDGLMAAGAGITGSVEVTGGTLCGTGRINRAVNVLAGGRIQAGLTTNLLGMLTIGGTLGLSNGAAVACAFDAVTNDVIAVTNSIVQEGAVTLKIANVGRTILPSEQFVLFRFTNSLVGFNANNWSFDFSESPDTIGSMNARVATNTGVIYLTGLQAPYSRSSGSVFSLR